MGYYSGGWSLVLIALAEVVVFAWIYGTLLFRLVLQRSWCLAEGYRNGDTGDQRRLMGPCGSGRTLLYFFETQIGNIVMLS